MKKTKSQYVINEKGKKVGVILPIEEYEKLLEDIHDLIKIAERKNEPSFSFDKLKKKLKKDGLL